MTSSRPEPIERLLAAATTLGAREGIGALSIQGIADAAGVSKALVLYHFDEKAALFVALHAELSAQSATRLRAAARDASPLDAWRRLVVSEIARGELPLIAALASDAAVRAASPDAAGRGREEAAAELAARILSALDLEPRFDRTLLGRTLLRHLDGVVVAFAPRGAGVDADALADELDAFALAFLALGE